MNPLIIDITVIVISILLVYSGYKHGFIKAAGSLFGLVVCIAAGIWGVTWLEDLTGLDLTGNPVVFVMTFIILAVLVNFIIKWIVEGLDLVRKLISVIPFVGMINRVLGALLGLFQAIILIVAIAYVSVTFLYPGELYTAIQESIVVGTVIEQRDRFDQVFN